MKKAILLLLFVFTGLWSYATTYNTVASGNLNNPAIWSTGSVPNLSQSCNVVNIHHNVNINMSGQYIVRCDLTVFGSGTLYTPNQFRIDGGTVIVWGEINVHNNLWMEEDGVLEIWYGGYVFVDNKVTYDDDGLIYLRGGTICWHNLWKGDDPDGVGVTYNDPHIDGIQGCYFSTGPLGITLTSFDVKCVESNNVEVHWVTENEENNDYFTIEKSSDLLNWQFVTTLKSLDNTKGRLEYSIIDNKPIPGIVYYRLSQTDLNGTITVFEDQWLRYSDCYKITDITIYPDPVTDFINVTGLPEGTSELFILDVYGNIVINKSASNADIQIAASSLAPGVYFLKLGNGKSIKFIKTI